MSNATPTCINDVIVDNPNFPESVVNAVKEFARSKPWRGDVEQRREKFTAVINSLNAAVGMNVSAEFNDADTEGPSHRSTIDFANIDAPVIQFTGRLSVATLFYLYAGCMAPYDETMQSHWGRMRWAANMFKRFFPRSFAALDTSGAYLIKPVINSEFPPADTTDNE